MRTRVAANHRRLAHAAAVLVGNDDASAVAMSTVCGVMVEAVGKQTAALD